MSTGGRAARLTGDASSSSPLAMTYPMVRESRTASTRKQPLLQTPGGPYGEHAWSKSDKVIKNSPDPSVCATAFSRSKQVPQLDGGSPRKHSWTAAPAIGLPV